jgi:glycosyltransferase involved in cell wall biosynthesis
VKALSGYLLQSEADMIHELLVVDDGSTDDTESVVREYVRKAPFPVRYLRQANKGPAAARNYGIREAQSNLVLFTDSDIIPQPDLVKQHLEWHNREPQPNAAVLGYVTWSPEMNATPFMRWYGERAIFAYRMLRGKREADFRFFYTCNLSLKTEFLRACGQFDENFKSAAYEDLELGYRLSKKGLQLLYNPRAFAHHHQFFSFQDACRKTASYAEGRPLFEQKEAGQHYLAEDRRKAKTLRFRLATWTETAVGTSIGWCKCLPDSRFPLPPVIYRCLYWYRVNRLKRETEGVSGN